MMQPVRSSNACYFEENPIKAIEIDGHLTSILMPYDSFLTRFNSVLIKGDLFLVHLMLKQAANSSHSKMMGQMINTLVQQALSNSSKRK